MSVFASPTLFDDGKAPEALRTIGEVANALGIRQHVLRYWEEQFPMLRPLKRSGGRRYYRPGDISLVEAINRLVHDDGYTLRGARLVLQGDSGEAATERVMLNPEAEAGGTRPTRSAPTGHRPSASGPSAVIPGGLLPELQAIRALLAASLET